MLTYYGQTDGHSESQKLLNCLKAIIGNMGGLIPSKSGEIEESNLFVTLDYSLLEYRML